MSCVKVLLLGLVFTMTSPSPSPRVSGLGMPRSTSLEVNLNRKKDSYFRIFYLRNLLVSTPQSTHFAITNLLFSFLLKSYFPLFCPPVCRSKVITFPRVLLDFFIFHLTSYITVAYIISADLTGLAALVYKATPHQSGSSTPQPVLFLKCHGTGRRRKEREGWEWLYKWNKLETIYLCWEPV